jgi:hypothetical protein
LDDDIVEDNEMLDVLLEVADAALVPPEDDALVIIMDNDSKDIFKNQSITISQPW